MSKYREMSDISTVQPCEKSRPIILESVDSVLTLEATSYVFDLIKNTSISLITLSTRDFFSRAVGSLFWPKAEDLTETGNRAGKVSSTEGRISFVLLNIFL